MQTSRCTTLIMYKNQNACVIKEEIKWNSLCTDNDEMILFKPIVDKNDTRKINVLVIINKA